MNIEWFESRTIPVPESGCWLWWPLGGKKTDPYGYCDDKTGHKWMAHRLSWTLYRGQIPDGLFVCHKCDVGCCVNPNHLFLGTHLENMKDMRCKDRSRNSKGEASNMAILTEGKVIQLRSETGMTRKQLSKKYGVAVGTIGHVLTRHSWSHI